MTVADIKEYIDEKLNNKPILSIETWGENGTQKLYTPLEHYGKTLEEIKSMLDELEPNTISQAIKIIENEEEKLKFDLDKHRVDNCIFELKNILGLAIYKDELKENEE